jgi:hypothetical protein
LFFPAEGSVAAQWLIQPVQPAPAQRMALQESKVFYVQEGPDDCQ